jgi:hypothetical protein
MLQAFSAALALLISVSVSPAMPLLPTQEKGIHFKN